MPLLELLGAAHALGAANYALGSHHLGAAMKTSTAVKRGLASKRTVAALKRRVSALEKHARKLQARKLRARRVRLARVRRARALVKRARGFVRVARRFRLIAQRLHAQAGPLKRHLSHLVARCNHGHALLRQAHALRQKAAEYQRRAVASRKRYEGLRHRGHRYRYRAQRAKKSARSFRSRARRALGNASGRANQGHALVRKYAPLVRAERAKLHRVMRTYRRRDWAAHTRYVSAHRLLTAAMRTALRVNGVSARLLRTEIRRVFRRHPHIRRARKVHATRVRAARKRLLARAAALTRQGHALARAANHAAHRARVHAHAAKVWRHNLATWRLHTQRHVAHLHHKANGILRIARDFRRRAHACFMHARALQHQRHFAAAGKAAREGSRLQTIAIGHEKHARHLQHDLVRVAWQLFNKRVPGAQARIRHEDALARRFNAEAHRARVAAQRKLAKAAGLRAAAKRIR